MNAGKVLIQGYITKKRKTSKS